MLPRVSVYYLTKLLAESPCNTISIVEPPARSQVVAKFVLATSSALPKLQVTEVICFS